MQGDKNLEKRIEEWISKQGYPLEMTVAAEFRENEFVVSLSDYYIDFETGKYREIDVTAIRWSNVSETKRLQVCWRAECKLAKDKPWILFSFEVQRRYFFPMNAIMTSRFREALIKLIKTEHWLEKFLGNSLLSPKSVGYGLTQAFTSGQDVPYQAVMSAVKSSIDRIEGLGKFEKETMGFLNAQYDSVCFPVVVIDGKLFEYSMDSKGSRQLREIPMGALYWQGITKHDVFPVVFIVTRNAIEEFVKSASAATNVLLESFEQHAIEG